VLRNPVLLAATLAGSALFFAFLGTFSYIDFRLERAPFSLSPSVTGLVFCVWVMGAAGPAAGRLAGQRGWPVVALGGLGLAAAGVGLSLVSVLPVVLVGLALITLGNFSGVTAAQLGVAESSASDRGLASALYFSAYYLAGAVGGYLPGLAFEAWDWPGVAMLALAAYAVGAAAVLAVRRPAPVPAQSG
jgi:YNFM family putative membrane transporter